jgi:peptide/nickel transport system substrate-binding protein
MERKSLTHRPLRRHVRAALFAISMVTTAALCAACGVSSPAATASRQLVWGKPAEPGALDPVMAGGAPELELLPLVYENLVGLDGNLKPVPQLADSWKQVSPTTYLFHLRHGVRFSNGRKMTADDVVGSLNRLDDPKRAAFWAGQLGIKDVTRVGADQVKIRLVRPNASFLGALAEVSAAVLPMRELNAGTFNPAKQLLGTGPFKVVAHSQNESWTLQRNPYYWRAGVPKIDKVTIRIMPDDAARVAALRDGSIDVTTFDNPDSLRLLKGVPNVKTVTVPTTDYYRLDVNAKSSIFRDYRLREALALSIDRNRLKKAALAGVGRPTAAVPVAFAGICDPTAVPFARPDIARAKQLVAAAGATGKTVEIIVPAAFPMASNIAQVLQQSLAATGLKVHITSLEAGELLKRAYSGSRADFDVVVNWYAGLADPAMVLRWWNPDLAVFDKPYVRSDPSLNKLIDASLFTAPGAGRHQSMRETCARIARDANVIPLLSKDAIVAYRSDRVKALLPGIEGYADPLLRLAEFTMK